MSYFREDLEREALRTCSSDIYYDLVDTIHETPDNDLQYIIDCNGNYELESKMYDIELDNINERGANENYKRAQSR